MPSRTPDLAGERKKLCSRHVTSVGTSTEVPLSELFLVSEAEVDSGAELLQAAWGSQLGLRGGMATTAKARLPFTS